MMTAIDLILIFAIVFATLLKKMFTFATTKVCHNKYAKIECKLVFAEVYKTDFSPITPMKR